MDNFDGNGGSGGSRLLAVTELGHIKELLKQLEEHLGGGSRDLCKRLASQIFSHAERSIGIISSADFNKRSAAGDGLAAVTPGSLGELDDDKPFRATKKRKITEKMKNQVRVRSAEGGETPMDDSYSWRKYGQKEILGAMHPRAYYRCTHRNSQGCAATKQVQRTDEDPALFDVIYLGTHTCRVHKMAPDAEADQAAAATQPPQRNTDARRRSLPLNLTVKTQPQGRISSATPFGAFSASGNWDGASPAATSDSNHVASLPPFEAAEWRAQSALQEVVSALVVAGAPPATAVDMDVTDDELLDIDVSCFFA